MLETPSVLFWLAAGALLLCWWLWALKHPLPAFACLVFVWATVYARASLPMFQVEGGDNRGGLALGDLMWLLFVAAWAIVWLRTKYGRFSASFLDTNIISLPLVAYVALSIILPRRDTIPQLSLLLYNTQHTHPASRCAICSDLPAD
jgi:hypothetical protein